MHLPDSAWHIEWNADGETGTATNEPSGVQVWITRTGFATVAHAPDGYDAEVIRKLMNEAQEIAIGPGVLH